MDNYYFHMDNLSVGYNRKALIHDICIVKKGEIVTLIGPNGSGKSTILKKVLQDSFIRKGRQPESVVLTIAYGCSSY